MFIIGIMVPQVRKGVLFFFFDLVRYHLSVFFTVWQYFGMLASCREKAEGLQEVSTASFQGNCPSSNLTYI